MEAAVKRAGNNAFRIACALAVLRYAEHDPYSLATVESITVTDGDANTGIDLALIYLAHSIDYAASLPTDTAGASGMTTEKAAWLAALPMEFTTSVAIAEGEKRGLAKRTVNRWLPELCRASGPIEKAAHGQYRKAIFQQPEAPASLAESAKVPKVPEVPCDTIGPEHSEPADLRPYTNGIVREGVL